MTVKKWVELSVVIGHVLSLVCPTYCSKWGLAVVLLCLRALSGCGALSSVLLSLLVW